MLTKRSNSPPAHRAKSRLSISRVKHESQDEPNGEGTQRGHGATTGKCVCHKRGAQYHLLLLTPFKFDTQVQYNLIKHSFMM